MSQKPIVVVLLYDPARAAELAGLLSRDGSEPLVAGGSDELYRLLNHQRTDLVVIEHDLRGFLSGLEIVERLFGDLLRPATILVGGQSADVQARARELGVDLTLPTSEPLEGLASAAAGVLAANAHSQVVIPPAARQLVRHADAIRPLPQLVVKLSRFLDDDKAPITEIVKDISVDPKMTAELLKLTNSTAMGIRRKLAKVQDAVSYLGIRRTVALVLSASVVDSQAGLQRLLPEEFRRWHGGRAVLTASTASAFAKHLEDVSPETAYILGLLQDVGVLLLAHAYERRYLQLAERVRSIAQLRLEVCEREDFGITHAEVSAALLQKWQLPQSLVAMVLHHHPRPGDDEGSKTERRFLHAMRIGEAAANLSDRPSPQRYQALNQLLAVYGPAKAEPSKSCLAEAVAKTAESSRLFCVPAPDEGRLTELLQRISLRAGLGEVVSDAAEEAGPPPAAVDPAGAAAVPAAAAARQRVLVVDDDEQVVRLLRRMLETAGLEVVACERPEAAAGLARGCRVVLCDMHLGGTTGVEVAREIRAAGFAGGLIIVSGDRTRQTVERAAAVGIDGYLPKPFDRRALLEKVEPFVGPLHETAGTLACG